MSEITLGKGKITSVELKGDPDKGIPYYIELVARVEDDYGALSVASALCVVGTLKLVTEDERP